MKEPQFFANLRRRLWSKETFARCEPHWYLRWLLLGGRALYLVLDSLRRSDVQLRASALTMVTLLSLVPALAVIFTVLTAFTSLEETASAIRQFVVNALSVSPDHRVGQHLEEFINNTNTRALGGVGVFFLIVTALALISNIESSFNQIWGVKRSRSFIARFQIYWPLLTLGPLLTAISLSASASVLARAPFLNALEKLAPFVAATLFFTLLYRIVPNTKVKTGPALIGGAVAGALWVLAQQLFAVYAKNAISYSQIYGSLAAIPIFILSIQLSWLVILFGANLVFAFQTARSSELPGETHELALRDRERIGMLLVARLADRYAAGKGPTRVSELENAGWPPSAVRRTITDLVEAKLIVEVESGDPEDPGYLPAKPPFALTERDVVAAMRGQDEVPESDLVLGDVDRYVIAAHRAAEEEYLAALERVRIPPNGDARASKD